MYGTRTALFMDVTTPRVAATQFTAYMAMLNFAISYSATWQGMALERWGYPITLTLDAALGLRRIALLPLMRRDKKNKALEQDAIAPGAMTPDAFQP